MAAGVKKKALAFPTEYVAEDPSVKSQTKRHKVLKSAKMYLICIRMPL